MSYTLSQENVLLVQVTDPQAYFHLIFLFLQHHLQLIYYPFESVLMLFPTFLYYFQDINRPGLQFAEYINYFAYERIQIVGKTEYNFFGLMDSHIREEVLDRFFSYEIPALIISRDLEIKPDVIEKAKKYKRILLSTNRNTTRLINNE